MAGNHAVNLIEAWPHDHATGPTVVYICGWFGEDMVSEDVADKIKFVKDGEEVKPSSAVVVIDDPYNRDIVQAIRCEVDFSEPDGKDYVGLWDVKLKEIGEVGKEEEFVVEKALSVLKIEYVTVDDTGSIVPIEMFEGESLPRPVVELDPVNLSVAGTHLTGTVSGSVRDAFADMVDGSADIAAEDVKIYANGGLVATASSLTKVSEAPPAKEKLIRPYAHRAEFSVPVSFFADGVINTVTVEVENAIGQMGADTARIPTTRSNPFYAEVDYTAYIENPLVFAQADTIKFYIGDRAPEADDPDFSEIEEDQAANLSRFEYADALSRTQLVVVDFTGLDPTVGDTFTGTARFAEEVRRDSRKDREGAIRGTETINREQKTEDGD